MARLFAIAATIHLVLIQIICGSERKEKTTRTGSVKEGGDPLKGFGTVAEQNLNQLLVGICIVALS
jgi:hypothetical protein